MRGAMDGWLIPNDAWKRCSGVCYIGLASQASALGAAAMQGGMGGEPLRYFDVTDFK